MQEMFLFAVFYLLGNLFDYVVLRREEEFFYALVFLLSGIF
jgi:hypothetical protein